MATLQQKFTISLMSAAVFVLVALPATYKLTNSIIGGITQNGCPTLLGLAVHAGIFYLLTTFQMKGAYEHEGVKRKRALIGAALFALLNSNLAYKLVRSVLGAGIASAGGCPTITGLLVHAGVYVAILVLLMGRR
jgi:hypothetical protein